MWGICLLSVNVFYDLMSMEEDVIISSIRISKVLAQKLEFVAKQEGISKTEIIRRSLEEYLTKRLSQKPKTFDEVLALINKRTGRTPTITKDVKTLFDENYAEEP